MESKQELKDSIDILVERGGEMDPEVY